MRSDRYYAQREWLGDTYNLIVYVICDDGIRDFLHKVKEGTLRRMNASSIWEAIRRKGLKELIAYWRSEWTLAIVFTIPRYATSHRYLKERDSHHRFLVEQGAYKLYK